MYGQQHPLLFAVNTLLDVYIFFLVVYVIMSWLIGFGVVNSYNGFVKQVNIFLYKFFEPVLKKIRPYMPELGGVDLCVLALFIAVSILQYTINYYLPRFIY